MDKALRCFVTVEFCCGGLREGPCSFFRHCNLFLGIMTSWGILRCWRCKWCLWFRTTIIGFCYVKALCCFVLNSFLTCKTFFLDYNKTYFEMHLANKVDRWNHSNYFCHSCWSRIYKVFRLEHPLQDFS